MTNAREQLAGLVEKWRGEAEQHRGRLAQAILRNKANDLAAILATLPEPGVVTDEVARVAVNAYDRATGEGWQMPCVQGMRSALEAALPYLAPAAPAGEAVVTRAGSSDGPIVAVTRQDGEGRVLSTIATYDPAPAAQGFDAEVVAWTDAHALLARFVDALNVRGNMITCDHDRLTALDADARKLIAAAAKGVG